MIVITPAVKTIIRGNPAQLKPMVNVTVGLWRRLKKGGFFGKVAIYPAIGVDALPVLATDLAGVNWYRYSKRDIIAHIQPVVPEQLMARLARRLDVGMLSYRSGVHTCRPDLLMRMLAPYRQVSPKSIIIKHYYEYAFLREWDIDAERFYDVPRSQALEKARHWVDAMVKWLRPGDTVVDFDPAFYPLLKAQADRLIEVNTGLSDPRHRKDVIYRNVVPVISLPNYAWVFRRISS